LKDIVLRAEALPEFLSSSLEHRGTVGDRGKEGSSELGSFLVVADIVEAVVDLPVNATECLVEHEFDSILEETEGDVNKEVESELGSGESHLRSIGDVMEGLEEVHKDRGFLRDHFVKDLRGRVSVEENSYDTMNLDSESRGES
jgi:hypothetical protein